VCVWHKLNRKADRAERWDGRLFAECPLVFYGIDWTREMMLGEVKREIVRDRPDCMMVVARRDYEKWIGVIYGD